MKIVFDIITNVLVFIIGFGIPLIMYENYYKLGSEATNLIGECQQELPRTEHCTIIAVPEKDVEE